MTDCNSLPGILYEQRLFATTVQRTSVMARRCSRRAVRASAIRLPHIYRRAPAHWIERSSPVVIAYLVRHGDAVPASENSERPLSPPGLEAVEQIARVA